MSEKDDPSAPGFGVADDQLFASTYDIAEVYAARRYHEQIRPIDGVISVASDADSG